MFAVVEDEVRRRGMSLSVSHLVFEEVIRDAGVSRAAAFRIWPQRELFDIEVLDHVVAAIHSLAAREVLAVGARFFEQFASGPPGDLGAHLGTFNELITALDQGLMRSSEYRLHLVARTWVLPDNDRDPETRQRIVDMVTRSDIEQVDTFGEFVAILLDAAGFRVRPSVEGGVRTLVYLLIAILEGVSLRQMVEDPRREALVSGQELGGDVRPDRISLAGAGAAAIIASMIEPKPAEG